MEYIHHQSEDLLKLNFNIIYQILEKVKSSSIPQNEYISFLFECLDKYGRKASILFQNIDFLSLPMKYFQQLLNYKKTDFDPIFINDEMLKSIYEKEIEIVKRENEIKIKEQQLNDRMNQIESLMSSFQQTVNELEQYKRIVDDINNKLSFAKIYKEHIFLYDEIKENRFDGIIQYLTEQCGGNVHEKKIVNVTMSSKFGNRVAENAVIFNVLENFAQTDDKENSWLKYDFIDKKVRPTHYSIRTRHDYYEKCYNPKTWAIEGSNTDNDNDWRILDKRDIDCFKEADAVNTFDITAQLACDTSFRFLRMRLIGPDTHGCHYLSISALEYFGSLIE